jgi:hypothetical protein
VEVVANLGERVLRRFPLKVAQLMDTAALHGRSWPHLADGTSQPSIPVDDRQHRRQQAARHEIVEAAFPRRERLASA